jgi:hypothetical protein
VKLTGVVLFAAGYVAGSRAGRERYEQIRALAQRFADRLEEQATNGASEAQELTRVG